MATKPNTTPDALATEAGLKFTVEATRDGKWLRFKFAYPDLGTPEFAQTVEAVTAWREKVKRWLFVGTVDTVAAKLTDGSRRVVAHFNRVNRRKLDAYWAPDAVARRLAQTQDTLAQAEALSETVH